MTWLKLALAFVGLANALVALVERGRADADAGARLRARALEDIQRVKTALDRLAARFAADPASMHEPDDFTRPDGD